MEIYLQGIILFHRNKLLDNPLISSIFLNDYLVLSNL